MKIIEKIKAKAQNPSADSPVKIAFLGDSVTHGCFELIFRQGGALDCIYDQDSAYPMKLKRKIEAVFPTCPVSVINAGISGGSAPHGAERLERDIISASPDLVVVCFGLNDSHHSEEPSCYIDALRTIFTKLRERDIDCIFMTPNMQCTYVTDDITNEGLKNTANACAFVQETRMDRYMDAARRLCNEENVTLCDCYADWKRLAELGADVTQLLSNKLNHPTRDMHELFADRLFNTIFLS